MISRGLIACAFCLSLAAYGERMPDTPLAGAARRGDVDEIDRLVAAGAGVDEPSGRNDWRPIVHAVHKRQRKALVRLLDHGASLRGEAGRTALMMASGYGDAGTVRVLLERGVTVPTTDGGAGSLMAAAVAGAWDVDYKWSGCDSHTEVVRTLLAHDPGLRRHLPNRIEGLPYSPASLVGKMARVHAFWYVRHKGCAELVRLLRN